MRRLLLALTLTALPAAAFAGDHYVSREHYKMTKSSSQSRAAQPMQQRAAANYEDSRYQKWASMTAEERDLAKQRGETTYRDWNQYQATRDAQNARNARVASNHHPDNWQGKTAEERDAIKQRNSVYERNHPEHRGHKADAWQGKTAEEKDAMMQRNSVYERQTKLNDGYETADERRARLAQEAQRRAYKSAGR